MPRQFQLKVDGVGGFLRSETPIVTEEEIRKIKADPNDWVRCGAVDEVDANGNVIKPQVVAASQAAASSAGAQRVAPPRAPQRVAAPAAQQTAANPAPVGEGEGQGQPPREVPPLQG